MDRRMAKASPPSKTKVMRQLPLIPDRPGAFAVSAQGMQEQAGKVRVLGRRGRMEPSQNQAQTISVFGLNAALLPVRKNRSSPFCWNPLIMHGA